MKGKIRFCTGEKGTTVHVQQNKSLHSKHEKLYIIGMQKLPSFQKYIVFHGYYRDMNLPVIRISPIFPHFPVHKYPFR